MTPRRVHQSLLLLASVTIAALLAAPTGQAAKAPRGFFGVHPLSLADASSGDLQRMSDADVGVIRTGFVFGRVKTDAGEPYDWSAFDRVVADAASSDIALLPVLLGVPPYVSTKPGAIPLGNSEGAWRDYLVNLVGRYGPGGEFWTLNPAIPYRPIGDWQIWNEQNALTNWKLDPNPREYGRLLVISADAIRSVDPDARIVSGGVISLPKNSAAMSGVKYLKRMLKTKAVRRAADVIAIHPYTGLVKDIKRQMKLTRVTLDGAGVDAPIWITEVGWGSGAGTRNPMVVSAAKQRSNLRKVFRLALEKRRRLDIGRVIWYQWRDGPNGTCKWCPTSGLLHQDGVAKPLLDVFRGIARN